MAPLLETRQATIGSNTYNVTQLGAVTGRGVFVRLVRVFGPSAARLMEKDAKLGDVFALVSERVTEADMTFFCDTFSGMTTVVMPDGKEPNLKPKFDFHFAGKYGEMILWLKFCLEVNFGNFFHELAPLLAEAEAAVSQVRAPAK